VPHDAPFGHCPNCLIELGFGLLPDDAKPSSGCTRRFGEYELLEQLGRGGMGVVYKARQVSLKRLVALKMLGLQASAFPGVAERLRLEAEAAGSLRHPQIVTIYDVGEHEGQPFFTMELIEGTGLDKCVGPDGFHLKTAGQETPGRRGEQGTCIVRIMIQIARAVDYAHKHGVLHRDLKPANVLVDAQGEPHLTDFGLAKVLGRTATSGTASGAIMGTAAYMSPEQASGATKHASTAADIYGLGAILYEMLTGRAPFRAETPLETLRQVVEEAPKPPSTLNHNVDRDLATICLKCLEKNPQHRYSSALAVAEDLEHWSRGEPIEARSVRRLERAWRWCRREPLVASLVGGLFLLLTTVAILVLSLYQQEKERAAALERGSAEKRTLLLDRIEAEVREPGRASVVIPAKELAAIIGREVTAGAEVQLVLGLHTNLRQPDQFLHDWGPLVNYFYTNRATAGGPRLALGLRIYTSRSSAVEGLANGEVDLMRADPAVYILARQHTNQVTPLVQEVYGDGKLKMGAAIFTRTNSGIDGLGRLKGKSFALGEPNSALGDFVTKAELVTHGLRTGDFLRITNVRSDLGLAEVIGDRCDAGVSSLDHIVPLAKAGGPFKILKELHSPSYPWVATTNVAPNIAEALKSAMLSLRDSNVLARLDYQLTGFRPTRPTDYDALARDLETARGFDQPR
jgi:ABC-type phosphate/phosphonate transport system substrate-binding protein